MPHVVRLNARKPLPSKKGTPFSYEGKRLIHTLLILTLSLAILRPAIADVVNAAAVLAKCISNSKASTAGDMA